MKRTIGETWVDKKGELNIKTENGTKPFYRALVEKYIGKEIPKGFTVHHIDFNHSNNELSNLMIIPTPLHVWVHRTKFTKSLFVSNLDKFK